MASSPRSYNHALESEKTSSFLSQANIGGEKAGRIGNSGMLEPASFPNSASRDITSVA